MDKNYVLSLGAPFSQSAVYLYLVSEAANDSQWVRDELEIALSFEFESKLRIVPVCLAGGEHSLPEVLSGRRYASLDLSHGGLAKLVHSLTAISGCYYIPERTRLSATVRLEEHGLVHTLVQARDYATDCEKDVLFVDSRYESIAEQYWRVSEVKFPPIDEQTRKSDSIANTVNAVHTRCRNIVRECRAVCGRFFATNSESEDHYLDCGHERILHELLHRLEWYIRYLRHLHGDESYDESAMKTFSLSEPFDGPTCDFITDGEKLSSARVPKYASSDVSKLFGRPDSPFASILPCDVGKAIGHILALRFMAGTIQSTEIPKPKTVAYGLS